MKQYIKKPIKINAIQYDGTFECGLKIVELTKKTNTPAFFKDRLLYITLVTGDIKRIYFNDYLIKGLMQYQLTSNDEFNRLYEAI